MTTIVAGVDESPVSMEVLEAAIEQASWRGAELHAVHVARIPLSYAEVPLDVTEFIAAERRAVWDQLEPVMADAGVAVRKVDLEGYPPDALVAYATSKGALEAMTRALAAALAPDVRVNALAPGAILWPDEAGDAALQDRILARTALGRTGTVEEIAALLRRSIVDSDSPWWVARTLEEWSALLPAELHYGADLAWLRVAFSRSDSGIRSRDLERAARELPPGAFRVLRALTEGQAGPYVTWLSNLDRRITLKLGKPT